MLMRSRRFLRDLACLRRFFVDVACVVSVIVMASVSIGRSCCAIFPPSSLYILYPLFHREEKGDVYSFIGVLLLN